MENVASKIKALNFPEETYPSIGKFILSLSDDCVTLEELVRIVNYLYEKGISLRPSQIKVLANGFSYVEKTVDEMERLGELDAFIEDPNRMNSKNVINRLKYLKSIRAEYKKDGKYAKALFSQKAFEAQYGQVNFEKMRLDEMNLTLDANSDKQKPYYNEDFAAYQAEQISPLAYKNQDEEKIVLPPVWPYLDETVTDVYGSEETQDVKEPEEAPIAPLSTPNEESTIVPSENDTNEVTPTPDENPEPVKETDTPSDETMMPEDLDHSDAYLALLQAAAKDTEKDASQIKEDTEIKDDTIDYEINQKDQEDYALMPYIPQSALKNSEIVYDLAYEKEIEEQEGYYATTTPDDTEKETQEEVAEEIVSENEEIVSEEEPSKENEATIINLEDYMDPKYSSQPKTDLESETPDLPLRKDAEDSEFILADDELAQIEAEFNTGEIKLGAPEDLTPVTKMDLTNSAISIDFTNPYEDILSKPQTIGLNDETFDRYERLADSIRHILVSVYNIDEVNDTITDNLIKLITNGVEKDSEVIYYAITFGKIISEEESQRLRNAIEEELEYTSILDLNLGEAA